MRATATRPQSAAPSVLAVTVKGNQTLTFLDEVTGEILAATTVGSPDAVPHEVLVTADGRHALVTLYGDGPYPWNEPSNQIAVVDLISLELVRIIDLDLYRGPHGMALDHLDRVWVTVEENQCLLVLDPSTFEVVRTVHAESRSHFLAASPDGRTLYSAHKELPYLGVHDAEAARMIGKIHLDIGSQAITTAPTGERIYVADFSRPLLHVIETATGSAVDVVTLGAIPGWPRTSTDGRFLFVSSYDESAQRGHLEAFETHRFERVAHVEVDGEPFHVLDGGDDRSMLGVIGDGRILRVDLATNDVDECIYDVGAAMPEQVVRFERSS